eukprot:GHVR01025759.1.p1 GENE.GHVR01025759.1~~GHVR01025759.1.p1  ORF type:complete len:223 (-),score=32.46 GHVR01025759.1:368-955(-)
MKDSSTVNSAMMTNEYFDEMGKKCNNRNLYSSSDSIYEHPTSKARIFIGSIDAAHNIDKLKATNVSFIVNCTNNIPRYHADDPTFQYITFDICNWNYINHTHSSILNFVEGVMLQIEEALRNGRSVLVHCLAGAHRAGTAAVLCMMYFQNMKPTEAFHHCRVRRPIIQPIGSLIDLLARYDDARTFRNKNKNITQ